ncbi:MAG TPA: DedA family protein [Alphaproteobacteria bacterium]
MDVKHLLLDYGPLVILVWTFFEGETVLLVAGFLAHQGYISLEWSILAAFVGSMSGDQLYFWIGRRFGEQILDWRPAWRVRIERSLRLLVKYQNLFILSFRFVYVVRTVASFSIGLAGVSFRRFTILNAIAAAIWALSFGLGGYWFGSTLESIAGGVQEIETIAGVAAASALGGYLIWRRMRRRAEPRGAARLPAPSGDE